MQLPDPPIQMRRYLAVAKRQGIPFEQAWDWADKRTIYPHAADHREQYKTALAEMRWAFELAYHDHEVPGGRACLLLAENAADRGERACSYVNRPHSTPATDERRAA